MGWREWGDIQLAFFFDDLRFYLKFALLWEWIMIWCMAFGIRRTSEHCSIKE